jgi:cytochrome c-type biogenesis protein CcmH/NrfF
VSSGARRVRIVNNFGYAILIWVVPAVLFLIGGVIFVAVVSKES